MEFLAQNPTIRFVGLFFARYLLQPSAKYKLKVLYFFTDTGQFGDVNEPVFSRYFIVANVELRICLLYVYSFKVVFIAEGVPYGQESKTVF